MEQFFTKFAFIHLETDLQQYGSLPLALVVMVLTQFFVAVINPI
jgi:hypothetical protein